MIDFLAIEPGETLRLRPALAEAHKRIDTYEPAQGLREAVDVAMLLGVPLLITGEPGTGKTSAARWLADQLGADDVMPLDVKSTTAGRDLLYTFDEVARFRDSSRGEDRPLISYVQFSALGEAILRAAGGSAVLQTPDRRSLSGEWLDRHRETIRRAFGGEADGTKGATVALLLPGEPGFSEAAPQHRVVLIDELDKAPRDTPNDLLAEINDMAFVITELSLRVAAQNGRRPIVLITSNSEKALPEPFLRRCAFFNIPDATDEQLEAILASKIPDATGSELSRTALKLYGDLRRHARVQKRPGTSELLSWLDVLHLQPGVDRDTSVSDACRRYLASIPKAAEDDARQPSWPLLGALMKSHEDVEIAMDLILA